MKKITIAFTFVFLLAGFLTLLPASAQSALSLYTPYTGISVTPGETIDYSFELLNDTTEIQQVGFDMKGLNKNWEYQITSGGWALNQLSVKPNDSNRFNVEITVPLQVEKGEYMFTLQAIGNNGLTTQLPLYVTVAEEGTFKTELTTEQPNMEGDADSSFTFQSEVKNRTAEEQHYAIQAEAPRGWETNFTVDGKSVTSVTVNSNEEKDISISINPPPNVKEGKYVIPVQVATKSTAATTSLEVVITGSYGLHLSTPDGRLSTDVTAGDSKTIDLTLENTGTSELKNISVDAQTPMGWEVEFSPKEVNQLAAGKSTTVQAKIKASDKAIAGDYVVSFSAQTAEASSSADFRTTVETPLVWGWIGVIIILAVLGVIFYLFRTYGRR